MITNRNNWAEGHLEYIGTGATTINAIGDDYERIRASQAGQDARMARHHKSYSLHCDKDFKILNRRTTCALNMEGDIQAGLFPS
jgi:hypothetical protein